MSKPYDASLKDLLTRRPEDWLPLVSDRAADRIEVTDSDVSKVTAATDKLIRVFDPDPWVFQIDFQSSYLIDLDARTHWYNAAVDFTVVEPVVSLVVRLHRRADSPRWTGRYERRGPRGDVYLDFRYHVVRAWQLPVEQVLTGGLGLVPMALLTDEAQADLPATVGRMDARLSGEVDPTTAADLWAIAGTLAGLRIDRAILYTLVRGITHMPVSCVFGPPGRRRAPRGGRQDLPFQRRQRLGEADPSVFQRINPIQDLDRVEDMARRVLSATDWLSLLNEPQSAAP